MAGFFTPADFLYTGIVTVALVSSPSTLYIRRSKCNVMYRSLSLHDRKRIRGGQLPILAWLIDGSTGESNPACQVANPAF